MLHFPNFIVLNIWQKTERFFLNLASSSRRAKTKFGSDVANSLAPCLERLSPLLSLTVTRYRLSSDAVGDRTLIRITPLPLYLCLLFLS